MKLYKPLWLLLLLLPTMACSARVEQARQRRDDAQRTRDYFAGLATAQAGQESEKWLAANQTIAEYNQMVDLEDQAFFKDVATVGAGALFAIVAFALMSGAMSYVIIQIRQRESRDYGRVASQLEKSNSPPQPPGKDGWKWVN